MKEWAEIPIIVLLAFEGLIAAIIGAIGAFLLLTFPVGGIALIIGLIYIGSIRATNA